MCLRFTQKHVEELQFDSLTTEQFLSVAIETSKVLGWIPGNINNTGFIAYTNNGIFSWNAEVRVKVYNGLANIQSQCRGNEMIEFGRNKENLQSFISAFNELRKTVVSKELPLIYKNLLSNSA